MKTILNLFILALVFSVSQAQKMSTDDSVSICIDSNNGWTRFKAFYEKQYSSVEEEEESRQNFIENCQNFL